jgi:hypothetical protein
LDRFKLLPGTGSDGKMGKGHRDEIDFPGIPPRQACIASFIPGGVPAP